MAIPTTTDRVPLNTADEINRRIDAEGRQRVRTIGSNPTAIESRLAELDAEWDVERTIEANAATLAFIGTVLGYFVHPYWLVLPALVTAFLLQHALQGWCPPIPVLRRLGFRTAHEIELERQALKALRGDYAGAVSPDAAYDAANRR
jgi:hypothetical protein